MLSEAEITFHRSYTKPQKYNREMDDKLTPVRGDTYLVPESIKQYCISLLPKSVLDLEVPHIFMLVMNPCDAANPVLPVHVDLNKICGINLYIDANGESTHYYNWNAGDKSLVEVERYVAERGDCWLMDTSVPHSVTLVPNQGRKILTFSFSSTPYESIKAALEQGMVGA
jgi:hypothetical protein